MRLIGFAIYVAIGAMLHAEIVGSTFDWSSAWTFAWLFGWPLMLVITFGAIIIIGIAAVAAVLVAWKRHMNDKYLMQALHDPENQPSQFGTVPLEQHEKVKAALAEAIAWLKSVQQDTRFEFDLDYTPKEERLIPRLEAVLTSAP